MLKLATFKGTTPAGDPLARVFRQGDSIRKVAGAMMPSVQDWLGTYTSDKEKIALLVNALGSSEFWGQNINGDIFPESALVHDCSKHPSTAHPMDDFTGKIIPPYGAWTFKQYAKPYVHHKNKDPTRAFGEVAHWCWNPRMHRVELVVVLDRGLALQHGAQHVVDRIDACEYPDVSMGCKVPYDICTICRHKSKTRHDYCPCVKEIGMGRILDDGRRIGVVNTYPRFFDISFVFIGADKTAKVMAKLGSGLLVPLSAVEGEYLYGSDLSDPDGGMLKAATPDIGTFVEETMTNGVDVTPSYMKMHGVSADDKARGVTQKVLPPPEESSELMLGKEDKQESITDGILRTNETTGGIDDGDGGDTEKQSNIKKWAMAEATKNRSKGVEKTAGAICKKCGKEKVETENGVECGCGVKLAAAEYKMGPPPMPNRKEYPFVGTINFRGLELGIENQAGTWRTGKGWKTLMKNPYGEFLHSKAGGVDGDKLDVYVGPVKSAPNVYIVHQNHVYGPNKGKYDEDKVMLGFASEKAAKKAYLAHYDSDKFLRSVTTMAFPLFKRAIIGGEVDGEKVASVSNELETARADLKLDDLFSNSGVAQRRQRTWRDKETGKELNITGSGMDHDEAIREKVASVKVAQPMSWGDSVIRTPGDKYELQVGDDTEFLNTHLTQAARQQGVDFQSLSADEKFKFYRDQDKTRSIPNPPSLEAGVGKVAQPFTPRELLKMSATKAADQKKWAEIVKEIGPDKATGKVTALLDDDEPSLPGETLDDMGSEGCGCSGKGGLESALSTPSMMGMVLKPEEFQRIMLGHMGKSDLAGQMGDAGLVFKPSDEEQAPCGSLGSEHFLPELMKKLMPHLDDKSYLGPVVRRRIIKIVIKKPEPQESLTEVKSPLLSKVASAYNWYRREQMKLAMDTPEFIQSIPTLREGVYDLRASDLFREKTAAGLDRIGQGLAMGSVPLSLMYSAHLRKQQRMGMRHGMVKGMIADHPWMTTLGAAAGMRKLLSTPAARGVTKGLSEFGTALAGN